MKKILLFLMLSVTVTETSFGQNNSTAEYNISMKAIVPDTCIPQEALRYLESKLTQLLSSAGLADNNSSERFVLTAKVNVVSKDIVSSMPTKISQKLELCIFVGDIIENKVFGCHTFTLSSIGTSESKAYITAFNKLNITNKNLQLLLTDSKIKIAEYYALHNAEIITRANTLASIGNYDEAIFHLVTVPNINNKSFAQCQAAIINIYQKKIDAESSDLLAKATMAWQLNESQEGADKAAIYLADIHPNSTSFIQAKKLQENIAQKLAKIDLREWDFKMKKYLDNQTFKLNAISACKAIGIAYAKQQPKNYIQNIISLW